ncbi:MAG: hypothetical protein ABI462_06025 [Ignavibacteria bacterium]
MDFSFKTDYNFIFIPAIIIIASVISYFYYKKTKLEGFQKKLFTVLRFLSLFFILLLLSSPVISYLNTSVQDPVNVFLIDNSQSLLIENRNDKLKEVLNDRIKNSGPGGNENLYFFFSGNLYREIRNNEFETIPYDGINNFQTNFSSSIYDLQSKLTGKDLSSLTIISDGMANEGGNPSTAARSLNVPVNYVLIGDTIQKNDLVLKNIYYNKTAFIESNVPLKAEINSYGYDRDIRINLYDEGKLLDSRNMKVTSSQIIYDVSFNVSSDIGKIEKYKIEIEGLNDEITLKNNYSEFFLKFVDNKFKVLVLAGGPSADLAFITREVKKIKNFEATILTQKSATEFYEGPLPDVNNFDSYIFISYPTAVTNQSILNQISESIDRNNSSLVFFAGRNTDYRKLALMQDNLPFRVSQFSENEEATGIKIVSSLKNDVFKNTTLISSVNSFPNIFKTSAVFAINSSAETFLLMSRNSEPAFVIENTEKNKSAAFLAYGTYKWELNRDKNNAGDVMNYILTSSVVAITDKEAKKAFTIQTSKDVYSKFENVKFEARITNYELQGGEQIRIRIKGQAFNTELSLMKKENKFYEGEINIPVDGDYDYTAELISKNALVESIQNRFEIGENNFEYRQTRADNSILNSLSNETSGKSFTGMSSGEISESLKKFSELSKTEFKSRKNFELNINPYYLGILIFLLCLEWFFRKRNSLP